MATRAELEAMGAVPVEPEQPKKRTRAELEAMGAKPVEPGIMGKIGNAALTGLDIAGSAIRPISDVPIALAGFPAGIVEYLRGKRSGGDISREKVMELGKAAAYGPTRAMALSMGAEPPKDLEPAGIDASLASLGVPEKIKVPNFYQGKEPSYSINPGKPGQAVLNTNQDFESPTKTINRKTIGAIGDVAADFIIGHKLSNFAKAEAPVNAVKATMATGSDASRFRPGTGERLLKDGTVSFFDTPEDILGKTSKRLNSAGEKIGESLNTLDLSGAPRINKTDLVQKLNAQADFLVSQKADRATAKDLRSMATAILDEKQIPEEMSLSYANQLATKEGTGGKYTFGEYSPSAKAEARNVIRGHVEDTAASTVGPFQSAVNPLTDLKDASTEYSYYKPVEKALKKRVAQLQQQPALGVYDILSAAGGAGYGGSQGNNPLERAKNAAMYGLAAPLLRRAAAKRAYSTTAKLLDLGSEIPAYRSVVPTERLIKLYNED